MPTLTSKQTQLVEQPSNERVFVAGPAGSGKTTAAVERFRRLAADEIPGQSILVLVPQLTLAKPYLDAIRSPDFPAGGQPTVLTFGGLARRTVELYWPVLAPQAGFTSPNRPPLFLTLELAQYYMAQIMTPHIESGYFDSITIDQNRLYSEVLDNLNKAAIVGFPHQEIAFRLKDSWTGTPGLLGAFDQVQQCAVEFRALCLERNLLDYSLQVEIFRNLAWGYSPCRDRLIQSYRHLIVDNLEEDTPAMHDTLLEWLPSVSSALLIYDEDAGYRRFLGADPNQALTLRKQCNQSISFDDSLVTSQALRTIEQSLTGSRNTPVEPGADKVLRFEAKRFYPEMIDWVAQTVFELIEDQGISPNEIAVLAPYLSDSMRFSLATGLAAVGLQTYSQRPSRALREEPAATTLLTLASLRHPQWGFRPTHEEVRKALVGSIDGLDLVRARLISEILYREELLSFESMSQDAQQRISFVLGRRYMRLREFLKPQHGPEAPLHIFLGALFGELLSQPGFGFHDDFVAGTITANLVESARKFRWAVGEELEQRGLAVNQEYVGLVKRGLIAAQYIRSWQAQPEDAVLLAPAYTFLLANRPVEYQIWVNVGSSGWWERPYQPLTHPYVLSRQWLPGKRWTDQDEVRVRRQIMTVLIRGLIRRCRKAIYLGLSELNEYGTEEHGPLLDALQRTVLQLQ